MGLLIVAMVMGTVPAEATTAPRVTAAWVRLAAVPGRPAAGYFTLSAGAAPVELVGVVSPLARIELHGMSMAGGVMRMDALPSVRVAANERTSFAPGGRHLMLFNLPASVKPGATVPLTFRFASGTTIAVDAVASAAGADAPMAMETRTPSHGAH
nr:copper chaperone PCu(A)C [Polymorphobacter sp.]